jgi:competence ComEA-like helix-hairpin-helix protein
MNPFVDSACAAPTLVPVRSQLRPRLRPWSRGGEPAAGGPPPAPAPAPPGSPAPPPAPAPSPAPISQVSGSLARVDHAAVVQAPLSQAPAHPTPLRRTTAFVRRTRHLLFLAALSAGGSAYGLDVNTATQAQLESIRGIGPKTATLIVKERQQRGRFSSLEDFSERVRGIGPKRVERLSAQGLTVGSAMRVNVGAPRAASTEAGRMPPALIVNTPDASKGKGH